MTKAISFLAALVFASSGALAQGKISQQEQDAFLRFSEQSGKSSPEHKKEMEEIHRRNEAERADEEEGMVDWPEGEDATDILHIPAGLIHAARYQCKFTHYDVKALQADYQEMRRIIAPFQSRQWRRQLVAAEARHSRGELFDIKDCVALKNETTRLVLKVKELVARLRVMAVEDKAWRTKQGMEQILKD